MRHARDAWPVLAALAAGVLFACAAGAQSISGKTPGGTKFKVGTGPTHSQESPERTAKVLRQRLEMYLKLADEQIGKGRYEQAISNLKAAICVPLDDPGRKTAYGKLLEIAQKAETAFAAARELFLKGEYLDAREEVARIATVYRGVDAAVKALRLLKAIDDDPKAQAVINEQKARRLYDLAQQARRTIANPDSLVDLYDRLRVLQSEKFALTESGKTAKAELAEIEADPDRMKQIARTREKRELESQLALARTYLQNGLIDKALAIMDEIVAKHADSDEAKTAAELRKATGR